MKTTVNKGNKVNKYSYVKVIQQNYGQGWEDVSEYNCDSSYIPLEFNDKVLITPKGREYKETLLKHDLREYSLMGYSTRVINRKVLNV
jgi:CO dehydrogenase/acetyl-CoA synthase alpha subunit